MKEEKFFGMIIPKDYGGLGFSPFAHSEVARYISTRSIAAAVTVMVPNSLGPAELLLQFGADAQKDHWLPRLADGRDPGLRAHERGGWLPRVLDGRHRRRLPRSMAGRRAHTTIDSTVRYLGIELENALAIAEAIEI
jgi:alkylation response protein AidB-like acyl-CoA dehydrogenase